MWRDSQEYLENLWLVVRGILCLAIQVFMCAVAPG